MPSERLTIRVLGAAAVLVAALGLGMFLGTPEPALAQEDTTTTTVADDATDSTVAESSEESTETDRPQQGDHDCGDRSDNGSSDGDSTEESSFSDV